MKFIIKAEFIDGSTIEITKEAETEKQALTKAKRFFKRYEKQDFFVLKQILNVSKKEN